MLRAICLPTSSACTVGVEAQKLCGISQSIERRIHLSLIDEIWAISEIVIVLLARWSVRAKRRKPLLKTRSRWNLNIQGLTTFQSSIVHILDAVPDHLIVILVLLTQSVKAAHVTVTRIYLYDMLILAREIKGCAIFGNDLQYINDS